MKIFIKQNSIVTEQDYAPILETMLLDDGYVSLIVPERASDKPYSFDDFELVNGKWQLRE